jgi:hypothetical protein
LHIRSTLYCDTNALIPPPPLEIRAFVTALLMRNDSSPTDC